jgi:cytochrome c-type biogenesis protein CcmF
VLAWKRGDLAGAAQRLGVAMGVALAAVLATLALTGAKTVLAPLGIGLGVWLVIGSLADVADRAKLFRTDARTSFARLRGLPRSSFGTLLAHAGMGVSVLGIVAVTAYQTERVAAVKPGESLEVAGYTLRYEGSSPRTGPNWRDEVARFTATTGNGRSFTLEPAKRFFTARQMATTEAAIRTRWLSQLYVSIGDATPDGALVVRAYSKPLVTLIWLGACLMAAGGALSLSDRRLRIGAPKPARRRLAQARAA